MYKCLGNCLKTNHQTNHEGSKRVKMNKIAEIEAISMPAIKFSKIYPMKNSKNSFTDDETAEMINSGNKEQNEEVTSNWLLWVRPALFMTGYFLANLVLTLHTKWLLSNTRFTFPWILSGLHIAMSGIGAWITLKVGSRGKYKFMEMNWSFFLKITLFSTLYSINIAMSNVSMKYVSLALHQVTRSGTPLITLLLEFIIIGKLTSRWCAFSLIPVVAGIILTVLGEMKGFGYTGIGLFLTILGVVLSSLKGVMTNFMLVGGFKMHPLELIALVAPWAVLQCILTSIFTGESSTIYRQYSSQPIDTLLIVGLFANGSLAFFLNWISFAVNKETSALAMTVAGNVKQAVSIGLAVIIFHTPLTLLNGLGILVTLFGGAWYR